MGEDPARALAVATREALAAAGDRSKAGPMQAYMRSQMPFYGVPTPILRKTLRPVFVAHPLADRPTYERAVRLLFFDATHREERYAAVELTDHRGYRAYLDLLALPLLDELIVGGAWWDFVDELAIRRVGPVLRSAPAEVAPLLRAWARDADLWRRRAAIIAQIGSHAETDLDLLTDAVDANAADADFFIRKAIGWALREYAKTDPAWVRAFVSERRSALSPLSQREARKHLTDVR